MADRFTDQEDAEGGCERLAIQFADLCERFSGSVDSNRLYCIFLTNARRQLIEKSRDLPPKLKVINTNFGGFYVSNAFKKYKRDVHGGHQSESSDDEFYDNRRIAHSRGDDMRFVGIISDFGKHVADTYPFLYETILLHDALQVETLIRDVKTAKKEHGLYYTPTATLDLIIKEHLDHNLSRSYVPDSRREFLEDVMIYGERDPRTWQSKGKAYITHDASDILHDNVARVELKKLYDEFPNDRARSSQNSAYLQLGLIAASGQSSTLKVEKIPALCGYTVQDYDGSESVVIT